MVAVHQGPRPAVRMLYASELWLMVPFVMWGPLPASQLTRDPVAPVYAVEEAIRKYTTGASQASYRRLDAVPWVLGTNFVICYLDT